MHTVSIFILFNIIVFKDVRDSGNTESKSQDENYLDQVVILKRCNSLFENIT